MPFAHRFRVVERFFVALDDMKIAECRGESWLHGPDDVFPQTHGSRCHGAPVVAVEASSVEVVDGNGPLQRIPKHHQREDSRVGNHRQWGAKAVG